jgi:hypothetical protein
MELKLTKVRLSFPHIFEASAYQPGDEPAFSAKFHIEKDSANDKAIREAIKKVAADAYKDKADKTLKAMVGIKQQFCYLDGDTSLRDDEQGLMVLSSRSKARPTVVDRDRTPLTATEGRPYAGCYVNALVDVWAQSGSTPGIRCKLMGIQFHSDGEAFGGGRVASASDFDVVDEEETADIF